MTRDSEGPERSEGGGGADRPGGSSADAEAEKVKSPDLSEQEIEKAEREAPMNADITFEVIRRRGEEELSRPSAALFFSGLAAGLSMGFSLVSEALLSTHLPDAGWTPLVSKLGYSVGFLMITLGSQQLFTENTLTAIIPLLSRRTRSALLDVARLWAVVLAANLIGAVIFALGAADTTVFDPPTKAALLAIGVDAASGTGTQLFLQGIFAGWLIALMVWMLPATQGGQVPIIVTMTYIIGLGGFPHIVAGSVEVLYAVGADGLSWADYALRYAPPTLVGNVVGGVALVSALNYAQVIAGGGRRAAAAARLTGARWRFR